MHTTKLLGLLCLTFFSGINIADNSEEKDCLQDQDYIKCIQDQNRKDPPDDGGGKPVTIPVGADFKLDTK